MESTKSPSKEELLARLEQAERLARETKKEAQKAAERAQQATERAEKAEKQNRETTFAEFLTACHNLITKPLAIQTDQSLTTKGSITSPTGRLCPDVLRPFDFRRTQQPVFDDVYRIFHTTPPRHCFPPLIVLKDRGEEACDRPLASESDLAKHQAAEVERPVKEILEHLLQVPEDQRPALHGLGEGIMFENHANTITENPEQATPADPQKLKSTRPPADRNCVYVRAGGHHCLIYIIEYKAAHKLTDAFLQAGLRPMNMLEEVVQEVTIPTDPVEKLRYDAAFLSCAAATQTYEYMIKAGLEWGMMTNGRKKVILRIPEDEPKTLEYDLLDPSKDAEPSLHDGLGFRFPYTAIGYQLGLTLVALRSPQRSQAWRNRVINESSKWEMDFEYALNSIPESERRTSPPDSEYREPFYPINSRSPYLLRRQFVLGSPPPIQSRRSPSPDSSGESDTGQKHLLSSPIEDRSKRQRISNPSTRSHQAPCQPSNYQYCTQSCLRGLLSQSELDNECPNMHLHESYSENGRHSITRQTFIDLISEQLFRDLDSCIPIGKEGLHGSIFAIQLQSYGYTVIGKGTTYDTCYESTIYSRLESLQGFAVPVYLGDIQLKKENAYYTDSGRKIIHFSLMAWGGHALQLSDYTRLQHYVKNTEAEVRKAGISHLDLHMSNFLWNEEQGRVMLIDFSRARVLSKRKMSIDRAANKRHRSSLSMIQTAHHLHAGCV